MQCRDCNSAVFYFTCNCGSKVFFDALGNGWPLHRCFASWGRSLRRTREPDGTLVVEISEGIIARRPPEDTRWTLRDFSIEPEIVRTAQAQRKKTDNHPIKAIRAYKHSAAVTITGVVREKFAAADIYKELDIDPTKQVASASVKKLGKQRMGRVTIHAPRQSSTEFHSYIVWLPTEKIKRAENAIGVTVRAHLVPVVALNREAVWYAERYKILAGG